ncbi:MAG: hypothetical protein KAG64_04575 [Bacteroidales bacterium]|nr:hypothetical protein [Bacteroidales bacterium]
MKFFRKYKLIILVALTTLLYGLIGVEIKDTILSKNNFITDTYQMINTSQANDSGLYDLNLDYRNPFFIENIIKSRKTSKLNSRRPARKNINKQKNKANGIKPKTSKWPQLTLHAIIHGEANKICVIELDGTEIVAREYEQFFNCKIIKIHKDSVSIVFNDELKIFKL